MTLSEYMHRMDELGYPSPAIDFWTEEEDDGIYLKGAASYRGGPRIGTQNTYRLNETEAFIQEVFDNITRNGRRFQTSHAAITAQEPRHGRD